MSLSHRQQQRIFKEIWSRWPCTVAQFHSCSVSQLHALCNEPMPFPANWTFQDVLQIRTELTDFHLIKHDSQCQWLQNCQNYLQRFTRTFLLNVIGLILKVTNVSNVTKVIKLLKLRLSRKTIKSRQSRSLKFSKSKKNKKKWEPTELIYISLWYLLSLIFFYLKYLVFILHLSFIVLWGFILLRSFLLCWLVLCIDIKKNILKE